MKTRISSRSGCVKKLVTLVFLSPVVLTAHLSFTTNNGELTVTGYAGGYSGSGPGENVVIPSMTNGLPVTAIGSYAFWDRHAVTNVVIPSSVRDIGSGAFMGCNNLRGIGIPDSVTNIGSQAFRECMSLKNLTIPDSVVSVGVSAFNTCIGLTDVMVGDGVTAIAGYSFHLCYSLTNVVLGSAVTNVAIHAFSNCYVLKAVYFRGNAPTLGLGVFENANDSTIYYLPGKTGWGATFGGRPTALWRPKVLTSDGNFGVQADQFGFTVSWNRGMAVAVDACISLLNPIWTPLTTNTLVGDTFYFSDPQWTNYPTRFYRLRWPGM